MRLFLSAIMLGARTGITAAALSFLPKIECLKQMKQGTAVVLKLKDLKKMFDLRCLNA